MPSQETARKPGGFGARTRVRGRWLGGYKQLKASNGIAPARWKFDDADWWLDENSLIMEKPRLFA